MSSKTTGAEKKPDSSHDAHTSATMAHERVLSARSSGTRRARASSTCALPSCIVMLPSTCATRRRSARAGVLSDRSASDNAEAATTPSTAVGVEVPDLHEVADQYRKRTPGRRESEVGVDPTAEQLEVVAEDEQWPDHDERDQKSKTDRSRRRRDQHAGNQDKPPAPRPTSHTFGIHGVQRVAMQLVGAWPRRRPRKRTRSVASNRGRCHRWSAKAHADGRRTRDARPCTAGGASSTSRASRPGAPRRRRAASTVSRPAFRAHITSPPPRLIERTPTLDESGVLYQAWTVQATE